MRAENTTSVPALRFGSLVPQFTENFAQRRPNDATHLGVLTPFGFFDKVQVDRFFQCLLKCLDFRFYQPTYWPSPRSKAFRIERATWLKNTLWSRYEVGRSST